MDTRIKPIPAFYCCYLLRSTVRHASLYIGSSPNPARRLAQHNGLVKGGAVRTSRVSLRPWEMTCVVAGFPSNIAALQFEWAWQNSHLTRHIAPEDRISFPTQIIKTNAKTGKTKKKPGRPRTSLVERLSNLHVLLRSHYFSRWPLELRFFNQEVYRAWQAWCGRIDTRLHSGIKIILDLPSESASVSSENYEHLSQRHAKRRKADLFGQGGVEGVDPTYARYQKFFEKSRFSLDDDDRHQCDVCRGDIDVRQDLFSMCTCTDCTSISHVTCLSDSFVREEGSPALLIPTEGTCPGCQATVQWSDLMCAVSLRTRGEKEIQKLIKGCKAATAAELLEGVDGSEDEDAAMVYNYIDGEAPEDGEEIGYDYDNDDADDGDDVDDVDSADNLASIPITGQSIVDEESPAASPDMHQGLEIVIEDSEDERRRR